MNEKIIKKNAQLQAFIAEINAAVAGMEGMKADNALRKIRDVPLRWYGNDFFLEEI